MRGRPPQPTNIARLVGNRRSLGKNPLDAAFAVPVAPMWLTDEAKNEWDQIVPVLARMRVISDADQIALAMLADALSHWKAMGAHIKKFGHTFPIRDKNGTAIAFRRNTAVSIHIQYGLLVQQLLGQFGMTPSARARISNDDTKETDLIFSRTAYAARSLEMD